MITSMPVLAILVAQTGHGWGLYTLLTELPTYMKNVLHFDIKKVIQAFTGVQHLYIRIMLTIELHSLHVHQNAVLSALPYFVQWAMSIACSQLADFMRERNIASTTTVRKLFNTIGKHKRTF